MAKPKDESAAAESKTTAKDPAPKIDPPKAEPDVTAKPAAPIDKVVDATGAGDLFAAGFLFGLARGRDHKTAAQLGALAASEVIQHMGARPEVNLKDYARQSGLPV